MKRGLAALSHFSAYSLLMIALSFGALAQSGVPKTQYGGFELPPYGTQNWSTYWDYNFGVLDSYIAGTNPFMHGILLYTSGSQPTCNLQTRGLLWTMLGSTDMLEECKQIGGSSYGWVAAGTGSAWYAGSGAPTMFYNNGDFYIDTASGNFYEQISGSWHLLGSLMGVPGEGVPTGGSSGQVLAKNSSTNYDTVWIDAPPSAWGTITGTLSSQSDLVAALNAKVPTTTTVNGHALSGNVTVSASDLTTGTLPHAQLPALQSADIPNNGASTTGNAATATTATHVPATGVTSGALPSGVTLPWGQVTTPPGVLFTPDQYGAVGNGSTDDTAAWQAALDAAYANKTSMVMGVPGKNYVVSSILPHPGQHLVGYGSTLKQLAGTSNQSIIQLTNTSGFVVEGFTLDGTGSLSLGGDQSGGVNVNTGTNGNIRDITCQNMARTCVNIHNGSDSVTVDNLQFGGTLGNCSLSKRSVLPTGNRVQEIIDHAKSVIENAPQE